MQTAQTTKQAPLSPTARKAAEEVGRLAGRIIMTAVFALLFCGVQYWLGFEAAVGTLLAVIAGHVCGSKSRSGNDA